MRLDELSAFQLDALREVGSIGAGHAATALSQLVDHKIEITAHNLEAVGIDELPTILGGVEKLVAAVYSRLLGDLEGGMLFVTTRESALSLVDMLHNREDRVTKSLGHEDEAMFAHAADIVVAAYVAALARLGEMNILPAKSAFAFDMLGAILQVVAVEAGLKADEALALKTEIVSEADDGARSPVDTYLLFLPDADSLGVLLGRLGVA